MRHRSPQLPRWRSCLSRASTNCCTASRLFVAAMLVWEHRMVKADDLSKLDAAFFTMNGIISLGFLTVFALARFLSAGSVA